MRYPYCNPHTLSVTACEMQRPQLSHSNMVPCYLDLRNVFSHPSQCDMKLIQVIHIVRHFESLFLSHSELKKLSSCLHLSSTPAFPTNALCPQSLAMGPRALPQTNVKPTINHPAQP